MTSISPSSLSFFATLLSLSFFVSLSIFSTKISSAQAFLSPVPQSTITSTTTSLSRPATSLALSRYQYQVLSQNENQRGIRIHSTKYIQRRRIEKEKNNFLLYATEESTESKVKVTNQEQEEQQQEIQEVKAQEEGNRKEVQEQEVEKERPKYGILNINTKGGVLIWGIVAILAGIGLNYLLQTDLFGLDYNQAGLFVSTGVMGVSIIAWTASYLFRVVNKDMTYAQQLKDYEDAVLMKRLEELQDDEVQALLEEVEIDE